MEITKSKLKNALDEIDAKISHVEDIESDNRKLLIKLTKQGNQIVKFLQGLELQDITEDIPEEFNLPTTEAPIETEKFEHIKKLLDEYLDENMSDLKEFEEEMEKHKDKVTPGQIGES